MPVKFSSFELVAHLPEILECILLQLESIEEIIRAQQVCRNWKLLVQNSPALQEACWYRARNRAVGAEPTDQWAWELNPVLNNIGFAVRDGLPQAKQQEYVEMNLAERIYDKPGSWTTMLVTQPPCPRIDVECYGDYSGDETM